MKSIIKLIGIIAIVAVIGFSFAACDSDGGGGGGTDIGLNGVWRASNGAEVRISGNSGFTTSFPTKPPTVLQDALRKGYFYIGQKEIRNLTSTGKLKWSGQVLSLTTSPSSNSVATGTAWVASTFTLSADGQTLKGDYGAYTQTWTRVK